MSGINAKWQFQNETVLDLNSEQMIYLPLTPHPTPPLKGEGSNSRRGERY